MRRILAVPLAPAAAVAVAAALVGQASPAAGAAIALTLVGACAVLAVASGERLRRRCWTAACVAGAVVALSTLAGPLVAVDLTRVGAFDRWRDALSLPLRQLIPEPEGGIVRGIVLGERASVDADLASAFARSGTSHLLAISGFNMTLVAAGVGVLVRGRLRAAAAAAATVLCVVAYSLLVGLGPSVARAALMATVAGCGLAFGRRSATMNALALAIAAMVAIDPSAVVDVGFVLSATATGGLLFLGDSFSSLLRRAPRAIGEGLATTLAATVPTLPVIAAVFGRVSLVSPIANLAAVPLFAPLMLAGAATAAVGVVSIDLARAPALVTYALAFALRVVVETSAGLPLASLAVPDGVLPGFVYAVVVAGALVGAPRAMRQIQPAFRALRHLRIALPARPVFGPPSRRWLVVAIVVLAAALVPIATTLAAPPPVLRVRALDVGQGDAYLVEIGDQTLLVDGGPDPQRLLAELGATLPPWKRRIDIVALTHAHADHADGLIAVLERYDVGLALEPVGLNAGTVASAWNDRIARGHVERRAVAAGARVHVGEATLAVLSPEDDPGVDVPSLVLRLERGAFAMLFMGDATEKAQADLLLHADALGARVYVPPHHGAATPYAAALVAAVRPAAALISVGAQNRYGHPTPETLAALGRIPTYRTDRDGTVELDLDGTQLVVRTHANGLPAPRGGSLPHAPPSR